MKTNLYFILLWARTLTWSWKHLGFRKLLSLGASMPDTVMHLCQPFRSKAQQPNMHGHTDKLSERHVKTALILVQHGPPIMYLSKQQAAPRGKRWNWGWWPSGSVAYQKFPSLHWKGITLQHMKTSHISATAMNRDPHSRRQLKTQYLVALLVHSIQDSANNCNNTLYYTNH